MAARSAGQCETPWELPTVGLPGCWPGIRRDPRSCGNISQQALACASELGAAWFPGLVQLEPPRPSAGAAPCARVGAGPARSLLSWRVGTSVLIAVLVVPTWWERFSPDGCLQPACCKLSCFLRPAPEGRRCPLGQPRGQPVRCSYLGSLFPPG